MGYTDADLGICPDQDCVRQRGCVRRLPVDVPSWFPAL